MTYEPLIFFGDTASIELWQYDFGVKLPLPTLANVVAGMPCQWHYGDVVGVDSRTITDDGGTLYVAVPDAALQQTGEVVGYIYVHDAVSGRTRYVINVKVRERAALTESNSPDEETYIGQKAVEAAASASSAAASQVAAKTSEDIARSLSLGIIPDGYVTDAKLSNAAGQVLDRVAGLDREINREVIAKRTRKPLMTFVDDDGNSLFLDKWKPILQEKGIVMTVPLITNNVGNVNYLTWSDIEQMKALGVEFVSHAHSHAQLDTLTEAQMIQEFEQSQEILRQHNCVPDILVYPGGANNTLVRKVSRRYFRSAIEVMGGINYPPVKTYLLSRISLGGATNNTLEYYKSQVDSAVANNGWIIWMSHSEYTTLDATQLQHIRDLIDYATSLGVEIVNVNQALDYFGNILDVGDYPASSTGAEYTVIDCDGIMYSKTNRKEYTYDNNSSILIDTPVSYFKQNAVTKTSILGTSGAGFPVTGGGTLETNIGISYSFDFQLFYPYNNNDVYKRTWSNALQAWNAFEKISITPTQLTANTKYQIKSINFLPETELITSYDDGKITVFPVNGSNTYNGKSGIVTTWRINGYGWSRQELREYASNRVYSRYVLNDNTWSAWEKISAI